MHFYSPVVNPWKQRFITKALTQLYLWWQEQCWGNRPAPLWLMRSWSIFKSQPSFQQVLHWNVTTILHPLHVTNFAHGPRSLQLCPGVVQSKLPLIMGWWGDSEDWQRASCPGSGSNSPSSSTECRQRIVGLEGTSHSLFLKKEKRRPREVKYLPWVTQLVRRGSEAQP